MYIDIGIENFKIFKDKQFFLIYPLTLLVGPNNSGKSSLIKLLLLLKNGLNQLDFKSGIHNLEDFDKSLNWESDSKTLKISIPYYSNLISGRVNLELSYDDSYLKKIKVFDKIHTLFEISAVSPERSYAFNVKLNISFFINMILSKQFRLDEDIYVPDGEIYRKFSPIIEFQKKYKLKEIKGYRLNSLDFIIEKYKRNQNDLRFDFFNKRNNHHSKPKPPVEDPEVYRNKAILNEIFLLKGKENLFDLYINNKKKTNDYYKTILDVQFKCFGLFESEIDLEPRIELNKLGYIKTVPKIFKFYIKEVKSYMESQLETILDDNDFYLKETMLFKILFEYSIFDFDMEYYTNNSFINELFKPLLELEQNFQDTHYLSANRGSQNRVLLNQSNNAIDDIINKYYEYYFENLKNKDVDNYLQRFLKLFNIEGRLVIEKFENFASSVSIQIKDKKINIADFGFGFSQLLPIALKVVNIYNYYENQDYAPSGLKFGENDILLIIEEPEANLHPNFQSKLADFFVMTINYFPDIRFVIETHSEYLIRKLQYLVAKKEINHEKIYINYFNADVNISSDEAKIKHIRITEQGNLTDTFGPGFYDETTQLQFDLLKLNKERNN